MTLELDQLLAYDPLQAAEVISGKSYKSDKGTSALGMLLHLEHSKLKREMLTERHDTFWGMPISHFLRVVVAMGFQEQVVTTLPAYEDVPASEACVYFHAAYGLLLVFDSYRGVINHASCYFNYLRSDPHFWPRASGSYVARGVYAGNIDAREGFRFQVDSMLERGSFLPIWLVQPFLSFHHHADRKDGDFQHLERIKLLPKSVQRSIAGGVTVDARKWKWLPWFLRIKVSDFLWKMGVPCR